MKLCPFYDLLLPRILRMFELCLLLARHCCKMVPYQKLLNTWNVPLLRVDLLLVIDQSQFLQVQLLLKENQMEIEDVDLMILSSQWAGVACIRQGKMGEGLAHLERLAMLKEPDDPKSKAHYYEGLVLLSSTLLNVGRKNDAITYLQMATAYNESYKEFLQQCENEEDDITSDLVASRRGDY
uniref:ALBINO3-like protein 3, mitochondrial n=1 Tax=Solanum lycopersicum TaxID=4081 RepID=A0A3Q7ITF5_SOLLC